MLHKKKFLHFTVSCLFTGLFLTSCSPASLNANNGLSDRPLDQPPVFPTYVPEEDKASADITYSIGDSVEAIVAPSGTPEKTGISYTVTSAAVFETPEAAGIDRSKIEYIELLPEDPRRDPNAATSQDINDYHLLKCMVTINNFNYEERQDLNISSLKLVYRMPDTKKVYPVSNPVYFAAPDGSAFPEQKNAGEEYHYYVPKGQSLDTQVIWPILPELHEKENLYLAVSYSYYNSYYRDYDPVRYIKLDLS